MSQVDQIFLENCQRILTEGVSDEGLDVRPRWVDGSPAHTLKLFGLVNRYDLSKEFPLLTLRKLNYKAAIDEILWIWQKKSNRIADLGSHIWDSWAGEDGTIGKAYGYQLAKKYPFREGEMDQVDKLLYDLRHQPQSRRILTNLYNFEDLHEMNLYPCAYSLTLNVSGSRLNGILNQRSQDMLVANGWNVFQYACLLKFFAHVSDLEVGELIHVIADAHIYDRHIPIVRELLQNPKVYDAPKLDFSSLPKDFYQIRVEDVKVENYQHGPLLKGLPVAI